MKGLVTGGTGFIGRHICSELLSEGHEVCAISRHASRERLSSLHEFNSFDTIQADLSKESSISKLPSDIDIIFHLASRQPDEEASLTDYFKGNVKTTETLLDKYVLSDLSAFVFSSTVAIQGGHSSKINEKSPVVYPISKYPASKLWAEQLIRDYSHKASFPMIILRYSSVYGPGQTGGLVYYYYKQAIKNNDIQVYCMGNVYRDIVHVSDIVNANIAVLESNLKKSDVEVFLVGCGESMKMVDIAESIRELVNSDSEIIPVQTENFNNSDVLIDISKAEKKLNYNPLSISSGIKKFVSKMEK